MKMFLLMTFFTSTLALSAPIPNKPLPESCRLKNEFAVAGHIEGVQSTKTYQYKGPWCIAINGSCVTTYAASCSLQGENLEVLFDNGTSKSYANINQVCREYSEQNLNGAEVKCEVSGTRYISSGGYTPSCNKLVINFSLIVSKKLSGEDLKAAKCGAISSCLENDLGYFERKSAKQWAEYYSCNF